MKHWVKKLTSLLEKEGYSDIEFDYSDESGTFYFDGYSDAPVEIKVEMKGIKFSLYDRYIGEKHFVYLDEVSIFN